MITIEQLLHAPEARTISGRFPLALDDPQRLWVVVKGEASVFVSPIDANGVTGGRRFVCQIRQGEAAFGATPKNAILHLVSIGDAVVVPVDLATIAKGLAEGPGPSHVYFAGWVANADDAFDIFPVPGDTETAIGHGRLPLAPGAVLHAPGELIWCRVVEGQVRWHGYGLRTLGPGEVLPLSRGQDILARDGALIDIGSHAVNTAEGYEAAILQSQAWLLQALLEKLADENVERREAFDHRLTEEQAGVTRAVTSLVSLVKREIRVVPVSGDALLDAASAVCAKLGIKAHAAGRSEDMERLAEPIEAIARASRFRTRRVLLQPPWYERDNGPLLGYRQVSRDPVALLPRHDGGYDLFDPTRGTTERVTPEAAATLEPFGVMFYGSLPDGVLGGRKLVLFAMKGRERDLIFIGVMSLVVSLLGMVPPQFIGILIDKAIPDSNQGLLLQMGLGLLMASLGQMAFGICQGIMLQRVEAKADAASQAAVWDRVLNLGAPFFRRYNVGDLNGRIMGISQIRQALSGHVMGTLLSSVFGLLNLVLMFTYSVPLALVAMGLALLEIVVTTVVSVVRLRTANPLRELEGDLQGLVIQLINGVPKLRASGAEARAFAHWAKLFQRRAQIHQDINKLDNGLSVFNELMPVASNMAIFYTASVAFGLAVQGHAGGLSTGVFLAFNAAYGTFLGAASQLSNTAVAQLDLATVWQRVKPVLEEHPEVYEGQIDPGRLSGRIAVNNVTFRYEAGGRAILDDVSLNIEPGEHVAFVGASGCGKSTLFRLLLGFEVPESGIITYDKQDLAKLDPRAVRRQLGTVLQAGKLNAGSIMENIAAGAVLTQDEVWAAIAGAGMEEDVRNMPMGLHTVVSEGGSNLSGGQRQRLLIARALALKPRIMLFDEATSALDNTTQAVVSATLDRMRATRIVIAHRLSTIRHADRIYVFDMGKIVQAGTFDELAAQEGLFSRLVARQTV